MASLPAPPKPGSAGNPFASPAVSTYALAGYWQPPHECTHVSLSVKIHSRPSAKVALLHLHESVISATLVPAASIPADGHNPWRNENDPPPLQVRKSRLPKRVENKNLASEGSLGQDSTSLAGVDTDDELLDGDGSKDVEPEMPPNISYCRGKDGIMRLTEDQELVRERIVAAKGLNQGDWHSLGKASSATTFSASTAVTVDSMGRVRSGLFSSVRDLSPMTGRDGSGLWLTDSATSEEKKEEGDDSVEMLIKYAQFQNELSCRTNHLLNQSEGTTITIENNTLAVILPKTSLADEIHVHIALQIKPISLPGKDYYTIIFTGLPNYVKTINFIFAVFDTKEEWTLGAAPPNSGNIGKIHKPNGIHGQFTSESTKDQSHGTLLINMQRIPSYTEIYDFKIRTSTHARFFWTDSLDLVNPKAEVDFELNIAFVDVQPEMKFSRNVINLLLLNGPEHISKENTVVTSAGKLIRFDIGGRVYKDGIELKSYRHLEISRPPRDIHQPITVTIHTTIALPACVRLPLAEPGHPRDLLEQHMILHEVELPLRVTCTPDGSSWTDGKSDMWGTRKLNRVMSSTQIEYPRVLISSMEPVESDTMRDLKLLLNCRQNQYVDSVAYQFETPYCSAAHLPLHLIMTIDLKSYRNSKYKTNEISRIHMGSFQVEFATINGLPVRNGMLFADDEELVILYDTKLHESKDLEITIFWTCLHPLKGTGNRILEYKLPSMISAVVGRAICFYPKGGEAEVISRPSNPTLQISVIPFCHGKATLSGRQLFSSMLFLQVSRYTIWKRLPIIIVAKASQEESKRNSFDTLSTQDGSHIGNDNASSALKDALGTDWQEVHELAAPQLDHNDTMSEGHDATTSFIRRWPSKSLILFLLLILTMEPSTRKTEVPNIYTSYAAESIVTRSPTIVGIEKSSETGRYDEMWWEAADATEPTDTDDVTYEVIRSYHFELGKTEAHVGFTGGQHNGEQCERSDGLEVYKAFAEIVHRQVWEFFTLLRTLLWA